MRNPRARSATAAAIRPGPIRPSVRPVTSPPSMYSGPQPGNRPGAHLADPPRRPGGPPPGSAPRSGRPWPRSARPACWSPGSPAGSPPPRRCCCSRPPCWRRPGSPCAASSTDASIGSVSRQRTASQPGDRRAQLRGREDPVVRVGDHLGPAACATRLGPGSGIGWVMKTRPGTSRVPHLRGNGPDHGPTMPE